MVGYSDGKSKYRKAADELRDNILSGRYAPGEPFPSVKMLCRRFRISHLTAVKALETLKGMGLVRSRNGVGTFVARKTKLIGLIVPTVRQTEIFPQIVREISRLCQGSGIGIDFADISCETSDNGRADILATARRMVDSDVSGMIFHPLDFGGDAGTVNRAVVKMFHEENVPFVILDSDLDADVAEGVARPDFVGVDNREIGEMAGRHVLDAGARSVAFVAWSDFCSNVVKRKDGLLCALARVRGAKLAGEYIWRRDEATMRKAWLRRPPDAVVCASDMVAANVLKLLARIGKRCPDDVLVTGVNDVDLATLVTPALTTVHQPCEAIAQTTFETLLWRMENPTAEPRRIMLSTSLVARDSTRADRKR